MIVFAALSTAIRLAIASELECTRVADAPTADGLESFLT